MVNHCQLQPLRQCRPCECELKDVCHGSRSTCEQIVGRGSILWERLAQSLREGRAIAAAVRRKYPQLQVSSSRPIAGGPDEWKLDIKGRTKAERDAAMAYAKKFAEGWLHKPG